MSNQYMGIREYARHRGVTQKAVQKAISDGRIEISVIEEKKKIDVERADKCWAMNTAEKIGTDSESYADARARREHYQANIAELDYKERVGELMDVQRVKKTIYKYNGIVRENLLSIPYQLAPKLTGMSDIRAIEDYLNSKIHEALSDLANTEKGLK